MGGLRTSIFVRLGNKLSYNYCSLLFLALTCGFIGCSLKSTTSVSDLNLLTTERLTTPRLNTSFQRFGKKIPDPYLWLEDSKSEKVILWQNQMDSLARAKLNKFRNAHNFSDSIYKISNTFRVYPPIQRGDKLFYLQYDKDKEKAIYYVEESITNTVRKLIDPNELSEDGSISVRRIIPSWDGSYVLYAERVSNSDESTIRIVSVESGKMLEKDSIHNIKFGDGFWSHDSKGFFYIWHPQNPNLNGSERLAKAEVRFHQLGQHPERDLTVMPEIGDADRFYSVMASKDSNKVFIANSDGQNEDIYVVNKTEGTFDSKIFINGNGGEYYITPYGNDVYALTNEGASRYKVVLIEGANKDRSKWKTIVPEDKNVVIKDIYIFGNRLVVHALRDAKSEIQIRELSGELIGNLHLPYIGAIGKISGSSQDKHFYFLFESLNAPEEVFIASVEDLSSSIFRKSSTTFKSDNYVTKQMFALSKDGTKVPIFLLHKKDIEYDQPRKTILLGYGGFNASWLPYFADEFGAWAEWGGIIAIANVRGGGEYGMEWYQDGIRSKKQNSIDDYISAAKWLIDKGISSKESLGGWGTSNGGLLVGAAMTQAPELFKAVVLRYPVLDLLRFDKVGIGKAWFSEYGNPNNEKDFKWLLAYSPYHNIKKGVSYPSTLLITADSDDRVHPMHARKFAAALAWSTASSAPVLLLTEKNAGHSGPDSRKLQSIHLGNILSFFASQLN